MQTRQTDGEKSKMLLGAGLREGAGPISSRLAIQEHEEEEEEVEEEPGRLKVWKLDSTVQKLLSVTGSGRLSKLSLKFSHSRSLAGWFHRWSCSLRQQEKTWLCV